MATLAEEIARDFNESIPKSFWMEPAEFMYYHGWLSSVAESGPYEKPKGRLEGSCKQHLTGCKIYITLFL